MRVLVACEFSGIVRESFRKKGHYALSCDLLPSELPGDHYQGDVFDVIRGSWDLIIAHPPCTYLCVSGNRWYGKETPGFAKRKDAWFWTRKLWEAMKKYSRRCCLENPVGVINSMAANEDIFPKPQYVQPWQFGHNETKKTGLWLNNLPKLGPTNIVEGRVNRIHRMPPSKDRGKLRSITYQGIANAMANQWG